MNKNVTDIKYIKVRNPTSVDTFMEFVFSQLF